MIAIAIFLPFILLVLFTFYLFDRLVKLEYRKYRKYWIADGKPIGFFWVPEDARGKLLGMPSIKSAFARSRFAFYWIYTTPEWTKGDAEATKVLLQFKLIAVSSHLIWFVWIIFVFLK